MFLHRPAPAHFVMRFDRIEEPTGLPVSVPDMHLHLRIDDDDTSQDSLIEGWITAAVEFAEEYTGRSLITQTWRGTADAFPACGERQEIYLKHGRVTSIEQITYLATDGTTATLDPSLYVMDSSRSEWRLAPAYGASWPITRCQLGAVQVDYIAGYGDAEAVPKGIATWLQVRVATLYEHRKEVEIVPRGKLEPLPFIDSMLDSYKVWSV